MKHFMIIAIIFCTYWVQAQQEFYYPWEIQQPLWKVNSIANIPEKAKTLKVTRSYTTTKGENNVSGFSTYDVAEGKISGISEYNDKNKLRDHYQVYYQDSLINKIERINAKGKIRRTYHVSSLNHYYTTLFYYSESKKGKLKTSVKSDYRMDGNKPYLLTRTVSKGKKEKAKSRWVYEYAQDNQLKTTTQYNKKGSVKHVWSHECKPEGEELYVSKDSTIVCKSTNIESNGDQVTIEIFSFDKNKTTKRITVRDAENHFKSSKEYNSEGILIRESERISGLNIRYEWKNYNKNGEITSSGISEYTKEGQMVYSEFTNHHKEAKTTKMYYEYYPDKSLKSQLATYSDGSSSKTDYEYLY